MKIRFFTIRASVVIISSGLMGVTVTCAAQESLRLHETKKVTFAHMVSTHKGVYENLKDTRNDDWCKPKNKSVCGKEILETVTKTYARSEQLAFYARRAERVWQDSPRKGILKVIKNARIKEELERIKKNDETFAMLEHNPKVFFEQKQYRFAYRTESLNYLFCAMAGVDSVVEAVVGQRNALLGCVDQLVCVAHAYDTLHDEGKPSLLDSAHALKKVLDDPFFTQQLTDISDLKGTTETDLFRVRRDARKKMYSDRLNLKSKPADAIYTVIPESVFEKSVLEKSKSGHLIRFKNREHKSLERSDDDLLYDKILSGAPLLLSDMWSETKTEEIVHGMGWSWSPLFGNKGLMSALYRHTTNAVRSGNCMNEQRGFEYQEDFAGGYQCLRKAFQTSSTADQCAKNLNDFFKNLQVLVKQLTNDIKKDAVSVASKSTIEHKET